jgi:hypothetical protein
MATGKNFAQMSSKKLRELMQHAEPEDAKAIEELLKARGIVDNKRLDELMLEKYPHIVYTAEQSDEFLKKYEGNLIDEDAVAWDFAEYVNRAEKFIVIKTIGKHDNFVEREFDDEESAKLFVSLMRESEQRDFIRYRITKVINY